MEKRALGKGLSALIPEKPVAVAPIGEEKVQQSKDVSYIKTSLIRNNSLQPRLNYNDAHLQELKDSIQEKGILQPILVREFEGSYEVIAGERRLRAARALNLDQVPVVIKNVSNQEALVIALVENIQREELNAVEEAKAFQKLIDDFGFTQEKIAQSVGKNRSTVSNTLRLLKLPIKIQKAVSDGSLSEGHARALLAVADYDIQMDLFERALEKGLSVREVEALVKKGDALGVNRVKAGPTAKPYELLALEERLQKTLGTKVEIHSKKKKGKIVVEYYSLDDLDRLIQILSNTPENS